MTLLHLLLEMRCFSGTSDSIQQTSTHSILSPGALTCAPLSTAAQSGRASHILATTLRCEAADPACISATADGQSESRRAILRTHSAHSLPSSPVSHIVAAPCALSPSLSVWKLVRLSCSQHPSTALSRQ